MLRITPTFTYGSSRSRNLLVQGDNVEALDMLARDLTGAVRCIYIDPPYNNGERYNHYRDNAGHVVWLEHMELVLTRLDRLLREDGSLWISIDDTEVHHLKVLADEVLGRDRFVTTLVWEHRKSRENRKVFSNNHEYILVYARDLATFRVTRNTIAPDAAILARYANPDEDPRGPWQSITASVQAGHATASQFYELIAPNGRRHRPPKGRCWVYTRERMEQAMAAGEVWFGKSGDGVPRLKKFLADACEGVTPETLWSADEVGTTRSAKRQLLDLFPDDPVFDTPKPEQLVHRILTIASDPGDLVLDAYLGSGTTTAVAHKMRRSWVGIEIGEHAVSHCAKRMRMVIDGEASGISECVGWRGGGGFRFYRLAAEMAVAA